MKFGGTSVGDAPALAQAAEIVLNCAREWERLVVVVSASSGVTDFLIRGALTAASGDGQTYLSIESEFRERHSQVVHELLPSSSESASLLAKIDEHLAEFRAFCGSIHVLGEVTPRAMDTIVSAGERINAGLVAALLRQRGASGVAVDATQLIVTDATFQKAVPLMEPSRARIAERLLPLLADGAIPVVTGFIGATMEGEITTLGRGGSDFSAAILGDCLDSDEVWIWTDVDGVMTGDPRLVPQARLIPVLSYAEVAELAYFGARVLHPRTIRPVVERGIPLWVKNTFNPDCPGTRIVQEAENACGAVKAVTAIKDLSLVAVEGRGMMGVPGIAARTFAAVASEGASVLMISQASSEQSICFVIPTETMPSVVRAIEEEMAAELRRRDIDRVWSMDEMVIVTAVGAGLRRTPGVAARTFGALALGDINVVAVAQGSSECSISLVVSAEDAAAAVRQIHNEVILYG
jgi:aspartate kinase